MEWNQLVLLTGFNPKRTTHTFHSIDVQDIADDDDDDEDDDEHQDLDNHFSMQPDDDFDENDDDDEEAQNLDELRQTIYFQAGKLREYECKMSEYEQYKASNDKFTNLYFALLQRRNNEDALTKKEVNAFKRMIISNLRSLRSDYSKKIQKLQSAVNAANMERKKLTISRDKMLKQKENENKALRQKNNESRTEYTRMKQSVDKIKRDNAFEKEQIIKKVEKLEGDKKSLNAKLEKQV